MVLFMAVACLFAADSRDLLVAIRNGDHARVQKLLRAGANVNSRDPDGTTALMHSVLESDVSMISAENVASPDTLVNCGDIPDFTGF